MAGVMKPTLVRLTIFPVKSAAGVDVRRATATPEGLRHDRRFAVVDRRTSAIRTQRELPRLAQMRPGLVGDELVLSAPDRSPVSVPPISVPLEPDGEPWTVTLFGTELWTVRVPGCRAWLRDALGEDVDLCAQPDAARPALTDATPYHVVNAASARDVAQRAGRVLGVERYRANLVVDGVPAWTEDGWRALRVGDLEFDVVEPCARCTIPTTGHG